jgi:hypothetical protein
MQTIDSNSHRTQNGGPSAAAANRGLNELRGSRQERADQLVRATVLSDLGKQGGASGIQGIATAIRKVLSKSDATGTDAPDDVLKQIEQSLKKAAQALADSGVDAKTIDTTIDKFRSQLADALESRTNAVDDSTPTATPTASTHPIPASSTQLDATTINTLLAREVRKQQGSIDLVTAEGDQVSIRFRTDEVTSAGVRQTTAADGATTTEARSSVVSRGRLQVEVSGDLNEEELAAIGDLLTKVDELATKFFSGDVQAAFAAAVDLGVDSDQIASYQLDLTYSRKVAVAAWGSTAAALPASAPSTQPRAVSQTSDASTPTSADASATPASTKSDSVSDAAGTADGVTVPATTTSTATPATARKTITDFIGDVLSKLGSVQDAGRLSLSLRWKVNAFVAALETLQPAAKATPSDDPTAKRTQLLGDSLQKAAA